MLCGKEKYFLNSLYKENVKKDFFKTNINNKETVSSKGEQTN